MNSLSWLLYLASVSESLGTLLLIAGILMLGVVGICTILSFTYETYGNSVAQDKVVRERYRGRIWLYGSLCFTLFFVSVFLPSKDTVYAIAASQVGEQMLKTQTANLAEQALNSWLKKQINPPVVATPSNN